MLKCYYCKNRMIHKDDLLKPMMAQRIACKQGQIMNLECNLFESPIVKEMVPYTNGK